MNAINRIISRATRSRKAGNTPDGSLVKDNLLQLYSGLLIFREKKQNFVSFRGKFTEKSANFAGFSQEKNQNSRKNQSISQDFGKRKGKIRRKVGRFRGISVEKSQISKDFQGKILRKIGWFHGKLRRETISKKQQILLDFFWQISLKSINFTSIWPALFNVFLTGTIIYSFNNSLLKKWANAKATINIMVSAQSFATFI